MIRSKRLPLSIALSLLFLVSASVEALPKGSSTISVTRTPIEDTFQFCDLEPIDFTGVMTATVQTTTSASGRVSIKHIAHLTAKGVGQTTGSKYTLSLGFTNITTFGEPQETVTITSTGPFNLNSRGGSVHLNGNLIIHSTVNANGVVTAEVFNFNPECE